MLIEIVSHTPLYVWALLAFLVLRGIAVSKEGAVDIPKSLIVPGIFIVWGLYVMFWKFGHPYAAFLVYVVFIAVGTAFGYWLYRSQHRFFVRDGVLFRAANSLPLYLILGNFLVKYALNVYLYMHPEAAGELAFNALYTTISGTTVGLFFGGVWNSYQAKSKLMTR